LAGDASIARSENPRSSNSRTSQWLTHEGVQTDNQRPRVQRERADGGQKGHRCPVQGRRSKEEGRLNVQPVTFPAQPFPASLCLAARRGCGFARGLCNEV